ncbi:energy transducer TonB [uncultured Desulfuromusa sp.]|uniref:energy transducer TonB family protein n=1 Tax=uncultured Desulfuromusa sp. TaxID=219183 RepID=UPI003747BCC8
MLVSLIISCIFHFTLLQGESGILGSEAESTLTSKGEEVRIPIEFSPIGQKIKAHQYTTSEIDEIKKLLNEAIASKAVTPQKKNSAYSLNQAKAILRRYLQTIREEIEKNKKATATAGYSNWIGNVKVGFSISRNGLFSNVQILDSSGNKLLDQSAMEAINKASGKIKRPKSTGSKTIQTSAVIKYQYGL